MAKRVAKMWMTKGGALDKKVDTNMVWLSLDRLAGGKKKFIELGLAEGLSFGGGRLVVHYRELTFDSSNSAAQS